MLQCHTSHSGSPLQYQYNSGPCQVPQSTCDWHPGTLESVNLTTQDHIWPYNTGHYDNKTEQFDETCHHPTEEILKYNSKGSLGQWVMFLNQMLLHPSACKLVFLPPDHYYGGSTTVSTFMLAKVSPCITLLLPSL